MPNDDGSVKVFARQYTSQEKGTKYYWGKYNGYEVRIFRGDDYKGSPSLTCYIKPVEEEEPKNETEQPPPHDDSDVPF